MKAIKKASRKTAEHNCINPDDILEPLEELRKFRSTVTPLASIGSPEHECYDTEDILRFCELVEDHLKSVINDLESVQHAYARS